MSSEDKVGDQGKLLDPKPDVRLLHLGTRKQTMTLYPSKADDRPILVQSLDWEVTKGKRRIEILLTERSLQVLEYESSLIRLHIPVKDNGLVIKGQSTPNVSIVARVLSQWKEYITEYEGVQKLRISAIVTDGPLLPPSLPPLDTHTSDTDTDIRHKTSDTDIRHKTPDTRHQDINQPICRLHE